MHSGSVYKWQTTEPHRPHPGRHKQRISCRVKVTHPMIMLFSSLSVYNSSPICPVTRLSSLLLTVMQQNQLTTPIHIAGTFGFALYPLSAASSIHTIKYGMFTQSFKTKVKAKSPSNELCLASLLKYMALTLTNIVHAFPGPRDLRHM